MSVEISGPQGYDFQYLNSLLLALEYLDKDGVEIYIEKKCEEDAQIIFYEEEDKYTIDIQVKSSSEEIDLQTFTNWIGHFESRSSSVALLNKLEENNRFAIFISDARSNDDVSKFIDDDVIHTRLKSPFNNKYLYKIKECMKRSYPNNKALDISRSNFLKKYAIEINNNNLRNTLRKIKLRERNTETYSIEKIHSILNKKFYIPQSKTDDVTIELLDIVRHSRGKGFSITTDLMHKLQKYSGKNILNKAENYIEREERESCKETLRTSNILLLTGLSFCGKSYLAKDIAQEYLEMGYNVERVGELYGDGGAITFIRHRSIEDRLLILEDPFGQVETKSDAISILNELRILIRESKSNRKIIVTSRKDILLDATSKKDINECMIDSHSWIDLTMDSSDKIIELWRSYYGNSTESMNIYINVTNWLFENDKTTSLQLGHIANIFNAKKELNDVEALKPVDIVNTARVDSNDLAAIIERRGSLASRLFIALGLNCNTYKTLSLNDLAFILNDCKEKPGIHEEFDEHSAVSLAINLKDEQHVNFPIYEHNYILSNEYMDELKYLNQHGYIQIDSLRRIIFVHPIYHFAAQLLFRKQFTDALDNQEIIRLVEKNLSSLSINANLCTLTILENFYKDNMDVEVKRLILIGLQSIFPSVRDKVIMFFDRRINNLDKPEQAKLVKELRLDRSINNNDVCWYDGMAYYNFFPKNRFSYVPYLKNTISSEAINTVVMNINNGVDLSSEEIWNLLNIENSKDLQLCILERGLLCDESFIRGRAIHLIFKHHACEFKKVDEYLDIHEHPEVIYSLFRGALSSWQNYSNENKRQVLDYFKKSLDIMSVSMRTKRFLENFEDEYNVDSIKWSEVQKKNQSELWNVWHEIFVDFLNKFPSRYFSMDEPHMVKVTDYSLKFIKDTEKVTELSTAWFNWLDKYLQYNLPQDYGMSVARYLMKGTGDNYTSRENIFLMMVSTENTSFITTNISVFIDNWNNLSKKEKEILLELYRTDRTDIKWIKAVSLNRKAIPYEIQFEILGKSIDNSSITDVVDTLIEKNLLEQCLNIHCGYPQPLWWNGYHHTNYKLWDAAIVEVLRRNEFNKSFDIALREVIDLLYNNQVRRIPNIYDLYEQELLKNLHKRKLVFEELFYVTISQNQSNKKLWDLLIKYSCKEEIEYYFNKIAENIELIENYFTGNESLLELFDKSIISEEIYPRLEVDNRIRIIGYKIHAMYGILVDNNELEKIRIKFEEFMINIYKNNSPRLFLTNKLLRAYLLEMEINSPELDELMENNQERLRKIAQDLKNKCDENYSLEDWIK